MAELRMSEDTIFIFRDTPFQAKPGWNDIPMPIFGGGNPLLFDPKGYITGAPGYWNFAAYLNIEPNEAGQYIVQFARSIGRPEEDTTGADDRNPTPGKDFIAHTWFFEPHYYQPTGVQFYTSHAITVEYAQMKAVRLMRE